jgi:hypothetical protein
MIATNAPGMMNRFFWNQGRKSLGFAPAVLDSDFAGFGSVEFSDKAHSYSGKLRGFFFYYAKLAVSGALNNPYAVEIAPLFEGAVGPKNWLYRMPSEKCGSYSSMCAVVFFASAETCLQSAANRNNRVGGGLVSAKDEA